MAKAKQEGRGGGPRRKSARASKGEARPGSKARPRDDEPSFLAEYRPERFSRPSVAVDLVIFTIIDADLKVLLVQRDEHPFKGKWALPGGFVHVGEDAEDQGEDLDAAAARVLGEETRLPEGSVFLEQLYTFGKSGRDPRMRVISVAHYALVRPNLAPFVSTGARTASVQWASVGAVEKLALAFDHRQILDTAIERIRGKIDYSGIAFELVPDTFTIPELRAVYEVIKGRAQDPGNFRRRFHRLIADAIIEKAPGKRITSSKPAGVYRFKRPR